MATETKPWTRAELQRLPNDGNRYEVLDGRLLVTPQASPPHQRVIAAAFRRLDAYVRATGIGYVVGPGAVPFGDNELQPDVQVIPGPPHGDRWEDTPTPVLVVEVLSRSSRRHDAGVKLAACRTRLGVPAVWLVDHHAREVHVHETGTPFRVERETLVWHPTAVSEPLRMDLLTLFREALGS
jgi:Uma2 family endonuclease